tara:strand:- start:2585 stop:2974 length:390 start_codon:yes stop_codon:yes gene_type:complete
MATLNVSLTLSSTDVSSNPLSMTVTDALTVGAPQAGLSKIASNVNGGADVTLHTATANPTYFFIKHTGFQSDGSTSTTNKLEVKLGSNDTLRLKTGEFAFLPVVTGSVVKVVSNDTQTILVEYAYFSAA